MMPMKMPISIAAALPMSSSTTAHGNRNTASTAKITYRNA